VLEVVAATIVMAVARHPTGPVGAVRPGTEICDVGPQGVDTGQVQCHIITRQAEPAGTAGGHDCVNCSDVYILVQRSGG
jgi:hypothetical protein